MEKFESILIPSVSLSLSLDVVKNKALGVAYTKMNHRVDYTELIVDHTK